METHKFFWPWSLVIMLVFAAIYGGLLLLAARSHVYKITGIGLIDYLLVWLLGVIAAVTPLALYLAFGFGEFSDTADGQRQQLRLKRVAQAEVAFLILYGLAVLTLVPQK